ncbi:hypothetical protein [Siminovitchia terrae]|uniref:hypothetical protein n=1 Tax=Siminovitchia terrae TaxID=1914933 RepID=UPI0028A68CB3|nr:hypothetical protein [Siminovitchia terrae]
MINKSGYNLSFEDFLKKLKLEQEYQAAGGTSYRQQTAKLSIEVALKVKKVHPFLDPIKTKKLVSIHLPACDDERDDDVSKMLRVIAKSMYLEQITPDEVKKYAKSKLKNKLKLKKMK